MNNVCSCSSLTHLPNALHSLLLLCTLFCDGPRLLSLAVRIPIVKEQKAQLARLPAQKEVVPVQASSSQSFNVFLMLKEALAVTNLLYSETVMLSLSSSLTKSRHVEQLLQIRTHSCHAPLTGLREEGFFPSFSSSRHGWIDTHLHPTLAMRP